MKLNIIYGEVHDKTEVLICFDQVGNEYYVALLNKTNKIVIIFKSIDELYSFNATNGAIERAYVSEADFRHMLVSLTKPIRSLEWTNLKV